MDLSTKFRKEIPSRNLREKGSVSVIVTGNFTAHSGGIRYCNVMIAAALPLQPRIVGLQLQFFSR